MVVCFMMTEGHILLIHLSGSRTSVPTTAPEPPSPEPEDPTEDPNPGDEQCSRDLVFDAATSIRGDLYFFKDGYSLNVR